MKKLLIVAVVICTLVISAFAHGRKSSPEQVSAGCPDRCCNICGTPLCCTTGGKEQEELPLDNVAAEQEVGDSYYGVIH